MTFQDWNEGTELACKMQWLLNYEARTKGKGGFFSLAAPVNRMMSNPLLSSKCIRGQRMDKIHRFVVVEAGFFYFNSIYSLKKDQLLPPRGQFSSILAVSVVAAAAANQHLPM